MEDVRGVTAPVQEAWNVHYTVTETGQGEEVSRPRLDVDAARSATFEAEDSTWTVMQGEPGDRVVAVLYDESGDSSATVHSDRLVLFDDERRFEARGDVEVHTLDGKNLWSEYLLWFEEERILRAPGFVRIVTPTERVEGYELEADERLDAYVLRSIAGWVMLEEEEERGEGGRQEEEREGEAEDERDGDRPERKREGESVEEEESA